MTVVIHRLHETDPAWKWIKIPPDDKERATMANPPDERDLESELFRMYEEGGKLGYWARYFYRLFKPHSDQYIGGVAAVRKMLEAGGAASGLATVLSLERPDLAVETLVLSEKWGHLFKPWDRRQAQENLRLANALLKQALHRLQIDKDHLVDELRKIPSGSDGIRDNRLRKLSGRYRQLAACEDEIPYSLQRFGMQDRMTISRFHLETCGLNPRGVPHEKKPAIAPLISYRPREKAPQFLSLYSLACNSVRFVSSPRIVPGKKKVRSD